MFKEGITYRECHIAAEKEILKQLIRVGIIIGGIDTDEEFINKLVDIRLGAVFFPHGLGHLIGCDTHDVAGYSEGTPERPIELGLKKLRTARILEANMVLTVEPGCYFIPYLLNKALSCNILKHYLNKDLLETYYNFGGIRLEDVVCVGMNGGTPINFTTCPRLIEEVESVMNGGPWPPISDNAPYLYRKWGVLENDGSYMKDIKLSS